MAGLEPAIHPCRKPIAKMMDARVMTAIATIHAPSLRAKRSNPSRKNWISSALRASQ
jgi:hypothetical protein